jgi:hypothetical protein
MTLESRLSETTEIAQELRGVVLLAGGVGRDRFAHGVSRSVLDLPVDGERTVLDLWVDRLDQFARDYRLPRLRVSVAVDRNGALPSPRARASRDRIDLEIVRDPAEYRGTAGVVKDLTSDYADDDRVLVATAKQILREPLRNVFRDLTRREESVSIVPHGGGELASVFLLQCARLREVPDVGFVDLKEQAIPHARGRSRLVVVRRPAGATFPIRTCEEYIVALRSMHAEAAAESSSSSAQDPFAETWKPIFTIVEPGAYVAPGAVLQDSVVLAGGRVEEGAAVARSVVCNGGVVRRGRCVTETTVTD